MRVGGNIKEPVGRVPLVALWRSEAYARALLPLFFSAAFLATGPPEAARFVDRIVANDRAAIYRATQALLDRHDIVHRLGEVRVPTLVLCGSEDAATPLERSREIAAAIPGARLEIVAGAGHLSAVEQPDFVSALVRAFLEEVGA